MRSRCCEVPEDGDQTLGPELQGQVHYWRSQALGGAGDAGRASAELATARKLLDGVRAALPDRLRGGYAARPDISLPNG
jgi:hypothetical protein